MKTKTLMIIISISVMTIVGIVVFGLAVLTFNFDKHLDEDVFSRAQQYVSSSAVERMLIQNQIDYDPKTLAVSKGNTFGGLGDPGCGAVIDHDSKTYWFEIDSISNPKEMELYSENPMPCKPNHSSCFCNAQMEFASVTIGELSYLTPEEEEKVGKRVQKYFETMPHEISLNKFVVGKYNFDIGEKYAGICGALVTGQEDFAPDDMPYDGFSTHGYFSGYIDGLRLWDFSLSVDKENLCAISDDAKIFEYQKKPEE